MTTTQEHPAHDDMMNAVVKNALYYGDPISRYGEDSFLCVNPDAIVFQIDNTILRKIGKTGQKPLLEVRDLYDRVHARWGTAHRQVGV